MESQVDAFWTTTGRVDSLSYEIMDSLNFEKHVGWLEGVKKGKLIFGYDTDLKVSGTIEISSVKYIKNCVIRIHYTPRHGDNQKKDIILCTCFAYTGRMTFDKGRYYGSINLVSGLARYTDDVLQTDFTICKNKTYKNELIRFFKTQAQGGKYKFASDLKDKKCTVAVVTGKGKPSMEVVQAAAKGLGAQVGVDSRGVTTFEKYLTPSKRKCTLRLPTGQYSVTLPGVEITDDSPDLPNRVAYHCEVSWKQEQYVLDKNGHRQIYKSGANKGKYMTQSVTMKKMIVGKAQVKKTSPLHYNNRGRWVTKVYEYQKKLNEIKIGDSNALQTTLKAVQNEATNKAASKLSSLTAGTKKYIITCYYLPIQCGQVVEFEYIASGIKLHVQAMVTNIEMALDIGARMKVTLKHVRNV